MTAGSLIRSAPSKKRSVGPISPAMCDSSRIASSREKFPIVLPRKATSVGLATGGSAKGSVMSETTGMI